jgi:hypothetical protein
MADRPVFLYAAVYDNIPDAEADYDAVFDLHAAKAIGTFDAAVIEKEGDKVHVHKREKPTQHGAWTGIGSARSSASCSRPRSSAARSSPAPPEASSATCGRGCHAATSRTSARRWTRATPL